MARLQGKIRLQNPEPKRRKDWDGEPEPLETWLWMTDWSAHRLPFCGVYVISPDRQQPCKIGISKNGFKRLCSLQTSHWMELKVAHYRFCTSTAQALEVEQEAHAILRQNGKAMLGEWFDVRPDKALEAVEWAALSKGIELRSDIPDESVRKTLHDLRIHITYHDNRRYDEVQRQGRD